MTFARQSDFSGKTACVTGAASGIGRATAALFCELGASVIAADRDERGLAALCDQHAGSLRPMLYDQGSLGSVEALVEAMGPIDILANNAGVLLYEPLLDLQWSDLDRVVATNLVGAIGLTKLVGAQMVRDGRGAIVHTGSQLSFNGAEFRAVYAATKAAISQFVKTAALEWGPKNVRVNCVAPGRTLTAINRHLLSEPEQYAECA